jgi:hypothetical protein
VIVIASIMALNPIAMDMMLPALPNIASAFTSPSPTGRRWCCRSFSLASVSASS